MLLGMDPATAQLAIELQLTDIDDLLDSLYNADDPPDGDERAGFDILRRDLQMQLQVLEGQVLAIGILKEEHNKCVTFSQLLAEERQAASDHQLALRLAGLAVSDAAHQTSTDYEASLCDTSECDNDDHWEEAKDLYPATVENNLADRLPLHGLRTIKADELKASTTSKLIDPKATIECCTCMEQVPVKETLTLACEPERHTYCRDCLRDLFKSALINTALFPPRCCKKSIPFDICRAMLPKELVKEFDLKVDELATPNPTYCSSADCSKFIQPKQIKADIGTCAFCKKKTCARCKDPEHQGLCPTDPHVQLLMDMAKRSKWQTCTKCKNLVELEQGCFHMSCRCTHQFCYLCGAAWVPRACTCPQWDEHYLTRAGNANPAPAAAPQPAARHVHDWERVDGANCQACGADYLDFAMRCEGCNRMNCWRCIRNRI